MLDFQGLASKVKAAAAKINFDQMAANDEYIHSDDLNVIGRNKRKPMNTAATSEERVEENAPRAEAATSNHISSKADVDNSSSNNNHKRPSSAASTVANSARRQEDWGPWSVPAATTVERKSQAPLSRQSTMPLLSVVANTLAQAQATQITAKTVTSQPPTTANARIGAQGSDRINHSKTSSRHNDSDSDDDDDDDENDAILSLIRDKNKSASNKHKAHTTTTMTETAKAPNLSTRHSTNPKQPEIELSNLIPALQKKNANRFLDNFDQMELSDHSSSSNAPAKQQQQQKKNPKRFLEDLDQRLSTPIDLERGSNTATSTTPPESETQADSSNNNDNNQWSWIRNAVASSRINALLGQPVPLKEESAPFRKGPLSRREAAPLLRDDVDDDDVAPVVVVHSSSVLAAEEQAELARLSHRSSNISQDTVTITMDMFKQNPAHSAFLLFTLLLALAAYFYSRNRNLNGLT